MDAGMQDEAETRGQIPDVDYAQLVKLYGDVKDKRPERKYSPSYQRSLSATRRSAPPPNPRIVPS
jgi:hypothetical protein